MIGDMNVGKTSLTCRWVLGEFPTSSIPTIAVELKTKALRTKQGMNISAQIWDTAGQEKYRSITGQ